MGRRAIIQNKFVIVCLFSAMLPFSLHSQTPSVIHSVMLEATVTSSSITLSSPEFTGTTEFRIYRKLRWQSATSYSLVGSISNEEELYFVDETTAPYVLYEYRVDRTALVGQNNITSSGYICSGFEVPATEWTGDADHFMGRILVLIEYELSDGITAADIELLMNDLKGEGWAPLLLTTADSDPSDVRDLILDAVQTYQNVKAVLLVGNVAVPLTAHTSLDPDGHAGTNYYNWPCDSYYGELNGTWNPYVSSPTLHSGMTAHFNDGYFGHTVPPVSEHTVPLSKSNFRGLRSLRQVVVLS
jgi:hypothetical protein